MASNPFTSFKKRYSGGTTIVDKASDQAEKEIVKAYQALWDKLYVIMNEARKDNSFTTIKKQTALLKQIGGLLSRFKDDAGLVLQKSLETVAAYSSKMGISDVKAMSGKLKKSEDWHYAYNEAYAMQVFEDSFIHIAAQTDKISADVKKSLRQESAKIFQKASVEGMTRVQASKALLEANTKVMPDFQFIGKSGRAWDNSTYFEMLARTVMHTTARECYVNTLANEGHDLVIVSSHGADDECANWEGEVLSVTGSNPDYPSLDEAIESGEIFHPRCAHVLIAYDEEIDKIFNSDEKAEKEDE